MKPLAWIGRSREDLRAFPREVQREIGVALTVAQFGGKHPSAKPLRSFGGAQVLEVVEDFDGDTYRAVYTVRFAEVLYVLHCFQKKIDAGHQDRAVRYRDDQGAITSRPGGIRRMAKSAATITNEDLTVTHGSGNVFTDLGFEDAEELQLKAVLTYHIYTRITALGLTQKQVCERLGIRQPDVSKLMHCTYTGFSSDRLLAFLVALDLDIDIVLRPREHYEPAPHLRVHLRQPRTPRMLRAPRVPGPRTAGRRRATTKKPTGTTVS